MADEPITDEALDLIEAGLKGVTPGPWSHFHWLSDQGTEYDDTSEVRKGIGGGALALELMPADAEHIARMDPDTVRAMIARIRAAEAALALAEAEVDHFGGLAFVDLGANPPVAWKDRALAAEAERDRLKEAHVASIKAAAAAMSLLQSETGPLADFLAAIHRNAALAISGGQGANEKQEPSGIALENPND